MRVRMTKSLGSRDACLIHVDHNDCHEGCIIDLAGDAAEWLVARGLASPVKEKPKAEPAPEPAPVEAVPEAPMAAKPEPTAKGVKSTRGKK